MRCMHLLGRAASARRTPFPVGLHAISCGRRQFPDMVGGGANLQLLPFFFEHLHSPHVGLPRPPAQH